MGALICVWSPYHGQCGTTATMLATANYLVEAGSSVCVTHTQYGMSALEGMLNKHQQKSLAKDQYLASGLSGLIFKKNGTPTLSAGDVRMCAEQPDASVHFYLCPGIDKEKPTADDDKLLRHIIKYELVKGFDYVLVDLGAGTRNWLSRELMQQADLNLIVLNQSADVLDMYFHGDINEELGISEDKTMIILGNYMPDAIPTPKYIRTHYDFDKYVGVVPQCAEYRNALFRGDILTFFKYNVKIKKGDSLEDFIRNSKKNADEVIRVLSSKKK